MLNIIPVELVAEIFNLTLPDILDDPHSSQSPLLVAHVCHDWRSVALSTPQLWGNLTLSDGHVHNPDTVLIEQWLGRANLVSLSLWGGQSFPKEITDLISRNNTKWKALAFHGDMLHKLSAIDPVGGFPSLRKLVIQSHAPPFQRPGSIDSITGFLDAPALSELYFQGHSHLLARLDIPWSQLTRYTTFRALCIADVWEILSLTPNLQHASLSTIMSDGDTRGLGITTLRRLKSLSFSGNRGLGILHYLMLPALETLDIGALLPHDMATLLSFFDRSPGKLAALIASTTDLLSFIPCLRAIPTLSSLRLVIRTGDEGVFTFLQRLGDDTSFLPTLESLTLVNDGTIIFPYEALVEALQARSISESFVQFRRVKLCWTRQPFFYPSSRIQPQLVATGVAIDFVFEPDT
ncbi:hypothetical protein K438DRAFT_1816906 [Mycena galopus ATCC 62051]|nr:hypothetical protein K438DRAFT_1816906 [Mycena galopus ATCC 62051]